MTEKIKENGLEIRIFFKYWSPSSGNIGFKENMNENMSFPLNRKSVATGRNKGFV